jgi:hypothetical protein
MEEPKVERRTGLLLSVDCAAGAGFMENLDE